MKNIKLILVALIAIGFSSCNDDSGDDQIVPNILGGSTSSVSNIVNGIFIDGQGDSQSGFTVDGFEGDAVTSYDIFVQLNNDGSTLTMLDSGVTATPNDFLYSFSEIAAAVGQGVGSFEVGDVFNFLIRANTAQGPLFTSASASASVACSPVLPAGSYLATATGSSTDPCCPNPVTVTDVPVTITLDSGIDFQISDFSGGLYFEWYDVYGMTADGSPGAFKELCQDFIITTSTEPYGSTLEGTGDVTLDENTGKYTIEYEWTNGFDDSGTVTLVQQ